MHVSKADMIPLDRKLSLTRLGCTASSPENCYRLDSMFQISGLVALTCRGQSCSICMLSCVCRLNAVSAGWHQCWPAGLGHCTDRQLWEEQTGECKSTVDRHKPLNCTIWSGAVLLSFALRVSRWPSTIIIDSLSASICDAVPWPLLCLVSILRITSMWRMSISCKKHQSLCHDLTSHFQAAQPCLHSEPKLMALLVCLAGQATKQAVSEALL